MAARGEREIGEESLTLAVEDGSRMGAYLARPDGAPRGGLLVFQEAFGVNEHIRAVTRRLAVEGYVALAPELFHRTAAPGYEGSYDDFPAAMKHIQQLTPPALEADIRAAHGELARQSGLPETRLAAIGFCLGGRVACTAAATVSLAAAIGYYGGAPPELLARVGAIAAPLLLVWGGADRHITPTIRRGLLDALSAAGKPFVSVVFSDAAHAFNCDARPDAYNPAASRQAWALSLAFLAEHLR